MEKKEINNKRRESQLAALESLRKKDFKGTLVLPTGSGKAWILIEALREIIATKKDINNIWYLCHSTVLRDVDFPNELKKWGAEDLIPKIKFMCYQTAYKIKEERVDVLLADECDVMYTPKYIKAYENNKFRYKILVTAYIAEDKEKYINGVAPICYHTNLKEIEEQGILNKSKYYYVNFLMTDEESKKYKEYNHEIAKLITKSNITRAPRAKLNLEFKIRERKRFLNSLKSSVTICKNLLEDLKPEGKKTIIFCELTSQADAICENSYHSNNKEDVLEKFRNDEIYQISVCGKINRGVNISNVENIVLESCNRSKTQLTQKLGRSKRLTIDKFSNVYFLIPCYKDEGVIKFTKVKDWVDDAKYVLNVEKIEIYKFK